MSANMKAAVETAKLRVAVRLQACWRGLAGRRRAAALRLDRQVVSSARAAVIVEIRQSAGKETVFQFSLSFY